MKSIPELRQQMADEIADAELLDAAYAGRKMPRDVALAFDICVTRAKRAENAIWRRTMLERAGLLPKTPVRLNSEQEAPNGSENAQHHRKHADGAQ